MAPGGGKVPDLRRPSGAARAERRSLTAGRFRPEALEKLLTVEEMDVREMHVIREAGGHESVFNGLLALEHDQSQGVEVVDRMRNLLAALVMRSV